MSDPYVWWNGSVVRPADARLDPRDRAVLYGIGLFETLRSYDGRPFELPAHLRRLHATAERLRLDVSMRRAAVGRAIQDLLEACRLTRGDASVRITVTGGLDGGGIDRPAATPPSVLIHARPTPRHRGIQGIRACRALGDAHRPIPSVKSIGYLGSALARLAARDRGCDEAIVASPDGSVLEGANSTIFARIGQVLVTPRLDGRILPSVTRRIVLEIARSVGIATEQRSIAWEELVSAREVLSVGSVREIAAVVAIDERPIGTGSPGPFGRRLFREYRRRTLRTLGGSAVQPRS